MTLNYSAAVLKARREAIRWHLLSAVDLSRPVGIYTEALLLDVPEVGEYARMALPANALEDKVALVFKIDDKNARLHPREVLTTGPDFVVANFFVQSYS